MQTTYNYECRDDIKVKICIQSRSHLRTFFHTRVQLGVKRCRDGLCIHNKQVPFCIFFTLETKQAGMQAYNQSRGFVNCAEVGEVHFCITCPAPVLPHIRLRLQVHCYIHIILAGTPGFKDIHTNCHLTTLHPHTMVLSNYMSVYIYMYVACSLPAKQEFQNTQELYLNC